MAGQGEHEIEERLRRDIEAYHAAALVFTAINTGLPDRLMDGPLGVETLAQELGLSPMHLKRFLRGLVTIRLCEELPDGRFALTETGRCLAPGSESSLREKALVVLGQYWLPWLELQHSLETGEPSFANVFDMKVADWRRANPQQGACFQRYLAKEEIAQAGSILEALEGAAEAKTMACIGGGYGGLLVPFLWAYPELNGVLFDEPQIIDAATPLLQAFRVAERVDRVGGDLLVEIPVEADLYLLKSVLQQCRDADALTILRNCRKAMPEGAQLVIIERLMPERASDDPAAIMLDLHMMAITGGRARSLAEFEALLSETDFALANVTPTRSGLSLIQAS